MIFNDIKMDITLIKYKRNVFLYIIKKNEENIKFYVFNLINFLI
jgi:hypothetical protein